MRLLVLTITGHRRGISPSMDLGLKNKVAVITGGSEGIGRETARVLAAEGAKVVICARRQELLDTVAEQVSRDTGGDVIGIRADVTRASDIDALLAQTERHFGRLDILINNAGGSSAMSFDEATDATWQEDLDLKLFAAIRTIRGALPLLRATASGSIVNLLNIAAKTPPAGTVPTSVTRAAGMALTKTLSKELAPQNIRVNAVLIGLVKAAQHERRSKDPAEAVDTFYARMARERAIPLGRVGETSEAANVVAFLASPRASYVTGVAINVDGGLSPAV